ncbi:LOB domain-containing protein 20-like [Salvia miltiorrhiza]|uniref:LOB domain-containing protein 20-like n=1 Tax=Salvia miltiorrhiza TaxID=226208 RepID=UPI0025AC4D9A|nr:LOB domain-containing protein 20-like [Salvia miltiorrhiza]
MDVPPQDDGTSDSRRKGPGKRSAEAPPPNAPCGACKFLRRKCISGCIFAPHFASDQGAARFAAVHKVFGASNVSKLLLHIPPNRRHDAVVTISYEAQARLSDPVYGCVSTIIALQQQVASLQAELSVVQTQLMNSRYVMANAFQNSPQQQQICYSNTSSASNNLISMHSFSPNFGETNSFEPMHEDHEEEEETHDPAVVAFANNIFQ